MNLTEEQRRKINQFMAEKRGWHEPRIREVLKSVPGTRGLVTKKGLFGIPPNETELKECPDFTRSLDACHEAEKALLNGNGWAICDYDQELSIMTSSWKWNATAEQRALALFTTLGGQL